MDPMTNRSGSPRPARHRRDLRRAKRVRRDASVTRRYRFGPVCVRAGRNGPTPSRTPRAAATCEIAGMKRFHSFRLDPVNQCLWRGEQRVAITPKAFDLLRYLVEHAGRLVTQDEILDALWPEIHVNPEVVKKYVLAIRKVLGDRPEESIFIETIPRRGYQFVAPVVDEAVATASAPADAVRQVVGRAAESSALDRALEDAMRGRRQVVFVTGEAGIGKTTLADVFHQRAAARPGVRIARGQCVEGFGGKEAYYPVLEALGQL